MGRPTADDLRAARHRRVDDLVADPTRLLVVGINPSPWTAATNAHFARPGNRFWPALHLAGITSTRVDASAGMPADAAAELRRLGVGITNICPRPTARADELSLAELREGWAALQRRVSELAPRVVAVAGVTAYRQATGEARARLGRQATGLAGAALWIVPNPSGLNAHHDIASLAAAYREAAQAAGVV